MREEQIDVVHAHDFYTNIFGITGAKLARVKVRIGSRRESAARSPQQRFVERSAYKLAQKVVANCEEVRRQLIEEGVSAGKVVTMYNGLDTSRVTPPAGVTRNEVAASFELPTDGRRFVTIVANLRLTLKDHPTFLRAARRVLESVTEVAFVIAGEGELKESLQRLAAELGLSDNVFFTGRCQRVAELLFVSDICVLSSTSEGFSNSILEYMAAGRPVVATDVGGAREAITEGETGYLVAAGDDEMMAERIISLLRVPERAQRMGERGRQIVEAKFSVAAQLSRAEDLYEELLSRKSRESGSQRLIKEASREGV